MKCRRISMQRILIVITLAVTVSMQCSAPSDQNVGTHQPDHFLTRDQTHNKFSSAIPPVLRVQSGAVIQAETEEASDEQILLDSTPEDVANMASDPIHPLTGPVYVEGAMPGDVLAVTLHRIEVGDYGWLAISPGFGLLADTFTEAALKTYSLGKDVRSVAFSDKISIPVKPFPGVMGVAPATAEMLSTIPPRANGGNMDDPHMVEGTTVYFPVFVEGALFSLGDCHVMQGAGEVCGTAIEAPMVITYEIRVIKGKSYVQEPQYETSESYAVTAFATTLDKASKKAVTYMIDYLEAEHGLDRTDAYMLCSLAGDLRIAEVVDVPNMLVSMHIPKSIFN